MGCGTCGTGKPGGCKSNGSCGTGSCNRMNVHDWLKNLPFADSDGGCKVVEVSFKQGSRKDFFRNITLQEFEKGELVTLEGVSGFDVGEVSLTGELVRLQMKKKGVNEMNPDMKKVLRRSTERDIELYTQQKSREHGSTDAQPRYSPPAKPRYEAERGGIPGRWTQGNIFLYGR